MADTKITDLDEKATGAATDEFVINDVAGGDADKKMGMDGLRIAGSQVSSGEIADARLSSNVPLLDAAQTFSNNQTITGGGDSVVKAVRISTSTTAFLDAVSVTAESTNDPVVDNFGVAVDFKINDSAIGTPTRIGRIGFRRDGADNQGKFVISVNEAVTEDFTIDTDGDFDFGGGDIANATIAATQLTGEIADARLSSNVPLLDASNDFTAEQTITNTVLATPNILSTTSTSSTTGTSSGLKSKHITDGDMGNGFGSALTFFAEDATSGELHQATVTIERSDGDDTKSAWTLFLNSGSNQSYRISETTVLWELQEQLQFVCDEDGSGNAITNLDVQTIKAGSSLLEAAVPFVIDGGGSAITTGVKGYVEIPFDCTITSVRLLADTSTTTVIDIWKDTYANYPPLIADTITASAVPTITTAVKSEDATLTGWTTTMSQGDIIAFNVVSNDNATRVTLSLLVDRT